MTKPTPRELDILKGLANGQLNKEIAFNLGISKNTVEATRSNLMLRLNIHSVALLTQYALAHKLIKNQFDSGESAGAA